MTPLMTRELTFTFPESFDTRTRRRTRARTCKENKRIAKYNLPL